MKIEGFSIRFPGEEKAQFRVEDTNLELSDGGVVCITGPTGCGKSSLLKSMAGVLGGELQNGRISELGQVMYLPQNQLVFPELNAIENASYFATVKRYYGEREQILDQVEKLGAILNIDWERLNKIGARNWSGGEAQRICLIRALSVSPDTLLLDEPCNGLDVKVRRDFLNSLRLFIKQENIRGVYVCHHSDEMLWIADELLLFVEGAVGAKYLVKHSSVASALNHPPNIECLLHFSPYANVDRDVNGALSAVEIQLAPEASAPELWVEDVVARIGSDSYLVNTNDGRRYVVKADLTGPMQLRGSGLLRRKGGLRENE